MNISSVDSYSIDIPEYIDYNVQASSPSFDTPDPVDQVTPPSELGAAAVVTLNAVAQDDIQTQRLQQDFLFNLDEVKNGNISKNEFSDFLEVNGLNNLNIQEETINNTLNGTSNNTNLIAALFTITQESSSINGESKLSSFANMMDRINEETQSADVRDKLQVYTQNLRN